MGKVSNIYSDFTPTLAATTLFGALGALNFGYDNGWWGNILGAPYFNAVYGSTEVTNAATGAVSLMLSSSEQSAGSGLGTAGIMIGNMIAIPINERYGRKVCFIMMGIVSIIGTIIQATSEMTHSFWHLVAGKIVVNISVGIAAAVVGVYLSETAPAGMRGVVLNLYSIIQNVGYVLAGGTVYAVVGRMDKWNYLAPIVAQFPIPLLIIVGTPFMVESPRWLVSKGRLSEATSAIHRLRSGGSKPVDDQEIEAEVEEVRANFEEQNRLQTGSSYLELFRGTNRHRTLVAMGLQCLQQGQGVGFMANYLAITLLNMGITNVFLILLVLYCTLLIFSGLGFVLPDYLGRRKLLLGGSATLFCCMIVVAAIATVNPVPTGAMAGILIAAVFIWVIVFSFTWSPMPWTISSEISSVSLREKTVAVGSWAGFAVGLIVTFVSPYIINDAYGGLGAKIGYLWAAFSLISGIWAWYMVPETKGRSLEELDAMFDAKIPIRQFGSYDTSAILAAKLPHQAMHDGKLAASQQEDFGGEKGEKGDSTEHVEHLSR